jgi:hypothetical protein
MSVAAIKADEDEVCLVRNSIVDIPLELNTYKAC